MSRTAEDVADRNAGRNAVDECIARLERQLAEARAEVAALRAGASRAAHLLKMGIAAHETEVAALRGHVELLAEWQAARRAELETPAPPDGDCSAWIKSLQKTSSVEARMLAADLGEEVGRG